MPDELEKALSDVQALDQQLQAVLIQKQALTVQLRELELALEEVAKASGDVYRSIGPVLVKSEKEKLTKELTETKEQIELRLKALEKQEKATKAGIASAQSKLQQLVKPSQGAGG